jgi:hypothetical protein
LSTRTDAPPLRLAVSDAPPSAPAARRHAPVRRPTRRGSPVLWITAIVGVVGMSSWALVLLRAAPSTVDSG